MKNLRELRQRYERFRQAVAKYKSAVDENQLEELDKIAQEVEKAHLETDNLYKRLEPRFHEQIETEKFDEVIELINKYADTKIELTSIETILLSTVENCSQGADLDAEKIKSWIPKNPNTLRAEKYSLVMYQ